jgi:glycine/D-amino acid oxidase-like deaminating enzyme
MAPHATTDSEATSLPDRTLNSDSAKPEESKGHRGLPAEFSCLSYWHRTTRAFPYLHSNYDQPVPSSTTYCIIGSGISGALAAWQLVASGIPGKEIIILEAREAVSGASGRNAGHVRPDAFRGFSAYAKIHGPVQARKIIENEKLVFERVAQFVKEHNVSCDFHETTTFDVCLTEEFVKYQAESFEAYKKAGGDVSHVKVYEDPEEARRTTGLHSALAAYEWPAGSSHPAKLAQWLLTAAIGRGVTLWTHCPVTSITPASEGEQASSGARWALHTPRGDLKAETVVHCTNAYSAYLLPEIQEFVTPNRAQAHSFIPSFSLSGSNIIKSTMSLRYSLRHFFSLIQRQSDGTVIFGVSRHNPDFSDKTKSEIVSFDDAHYNSEISSVCTKTFNSLFPEAEGTKERHGEGGDHFWTGTIGMTTDSIPLVGKVTGKEGQWICAGFNGHGMARIFTCAPGLVKLMRGESWEETGLPECFEYSDERIQRARKEQIKGVW